MYALILAGGVGTRLWPRSRRNRPKQLLDIASEHTMLQETFIRIEPLIPAENVYVVTNRDYVSEIHRQLPQVPAENVLGEPAGRNTAPAIGLGMVHIQQREPSAVVATLSADHVIQDREEFINVLRAAAVVAKEGYLVTIGIEPSSPQTGYGYIELGPELTTVGRHRIHKVQRFTEKPDRQLAERFVADGKHLWNAGMFVWRADKVLASIEQYLPALHKALMNVKASIGTPKEEQVLEGIWRSVQNISIDVGVLERADNVVVIPADIRWSDVGTWASLADILTLDKEGNVVLGTEHVGVDTTDSLIYGRDRLIATVGLRDMIIVDTADALLVCPKDRAQEVKDLVDKLKSSHRHHYL